jgi:hypothetical protein
MRIAPIILMACFFTAAHAVAADTPPANATRACVDVQIGNDRSAYLNCLNDGLQRQVEHERSTPQIIAPIDTHSSSSQVGTFNDAAARERMGNAFGVSPVPQRPARVFVNPIAPPTTR